MTNTVYDIITDLYDRIEALEAHNADLLAAAEALLDRLDTMTTEEFRHGGEREQRESLHAEVQKSKREKPKMTNTQNIVFIGSGHLLSILAENDLLRAENTRLRATIECSLKPAPVGPCPAGGEHDWPAGAGEIYTGVCLKCGRGR